MSALGHKRTFRSAIAMSALLPKADTLSEACPLLRRKRTLGVRASLPHGDLARIYEFGDSQLEHVFRTLSDRARSLMGLKVCFYAYTRISARWQKNARFDLNLFAHLEIYSGCVGLYHVQNPSCARRRPTLCAQIGRPPRFNLATGQCSALI
jgi:hypothetical protein